MHGLELSEKTTDELQEVGNFVGIAQNKQTLLWLICDKMEELGMKPQGPTIKIKAPSVEDASRIEGLLSDVLSEPETFDAINEFEEGIEPVFAPDLDNLDEERFTEPDLRNTIVSMVEINEVRINEPSWRNMMICVMRELVQRGVTAEEIVKHIRSSRLKLGNIDKRNYTFFADLGLSMMSGSGPIYWAATKKLCRRWEMVVSVAFEWDASKKSQYPGRIGIIETDCDHGVFL